MASVGSKLYLFGGLNNSVGWLDDFFVFDTGLVAILVTIVSNPDPCRFPNFRVQFSSDSLRIIYSVQFEIIFQGFKFSSLMDIVQFSILHQ